MKLSHAMEVFYGEVQREHLDESGALPQKLLALLNGGFVEEEECVFLSLLKKEGPVRRVDFADRTAYECFVNHLHVEDYLENGGLPPLEMLGRGIALARELQERLARLHGKKHFRIIVAFDGSSCTVRFHTIRTDEEWVDKHVNGHGKEAIAILETHELEP